MNRKPIILLSAGYEIGPNGLSRRYLYQNYADCVADAGAIPIMPLDRGALADEMAELADGLLLTGGPDIFPEEYGQKMLPECGKLDRERDDDEKKLITAFLKAKKPIFGICRGLQILTVYFNGTLFQDLVSQKGLYHSSSEDPHHCVHETTLEKGSILYNLYGEKMLTNSYHHQSVDKAPDGFKITARSGGIVEAIEHESLPVFAVQWHPERMTGKGRMEHQGPDSLPIFKHFLSLCQK